MLRQPQGGDGRHGRFQRRRRIAHDEKIRLQVCSQCNTCNVYMYDIKLSKYRPYRLK